MFAYQLKPEDKIFIVTWFPPKYPQLIIYEVICITTFYDLSYENKGYTSVSIVNLITSIRTSIVFWNDVDLDKGEYGANMIRTTNEQLAIKKFEEVCSLSDSKKV